VVFLREVAKQDGKCVIPIQYPQNQQLAHWANYLRCESHKLFTTGTSKFKLENSMELAELGFYKKNNVFRYCILRRSNIFLWQMLLIPKRQKKSPLMMANQKK
jgi:hypothetical protein